MLANLHPPFNRSQLRRVVPEPCGVCVVGVGALCVCRVEWRAGLAAIGGFPSLFRGFRGPGLILAGAGPLEAGKWHSEAVAGFLADCLAEA
jgi:hypothetical protein